MILYPIRIENFTTFADSFDSVRGGHVTVVEEITLLTE